MKKFENNIHFFQQLYLVNDKNLSLSKIMLRITVSVCCSSWFSIRSPARIVSNFLKMHLHSNFESLEEFWEQFSDMHFFSEWM